MLRPSVGLGQHHQCNRQFTSRRRLTTAAALTSFAGTKSHTFGVMLQSELVQKALPPVVAATYDPNS